MVNLLNTYRLGVLLLAPMLIGGCIGTPEKPEDLVVEPVQQSTNMGGYINEVSQAMADQLIRNTDLTQFSQNPVAITSFVNLENFDETNRVGEIIAENMVHELQVRGHKVIDFKMMPYIRVTPKGDFVRSREIEELVARHDINIVLTGTYVFHSDGLVVNARMMEFESGVVVSSAQGSVPGWYVDAIDRVRTGHYEEAPVADVEVGEVSEMHSSSGVGGDPTAEVGGVPAVTPTASGFSRDLQALDDLLFDSEGAEQKGGDAVEEPAADPMENRVDGGRYLCSPEGICFDRQNSGAIESAGVAQL